MQVRLACCPGCERACILVLMVSTGNIRVCSRIPATAPASMCCRTTPYIIRVALSHLLVHDTICNIKHT